MDKESKEGPTSWQVILHKRWNDESGTPISWEGANHLADQQQKQFARERAINRAILEIAIDDICQERPDKSHLN
jgi:hypothetical protein